MLLTGSYTLLGGLGSVMWTDAVQCLMLVGGGIVLFFVALGKVPGGWEAMVAAAPERFHLYRPPADPEAPFLGLIVASFGVFLFYQSTNQVMIQRVLSAPQHLGRDDGHHLCRLHQSGAPARDVPARPGGLSLARRPPPWSLAAARSPGPGVPVRARHVRPSGIRGVILAGFLAAVMSTVSALANAVATIFSLDVYRRFWRKHAGDAELIATGRISCRAALTLAALAAPWVATVGLFRYFQTGVTYMATPFISVMLLGIFWRRTSYAGAVAGLGGGLLIQIALALALWAAARRSTGSTSARSPSSSPWRLIASSRRSEAPSDRASDALPLASRPGWILRRAPHPPLVAAGEALVRPLRPRLVHDLRGLLVGKSGSAIAAALQTPRNVVHQRVYPTAGASGRTDEPRSWAQTRCY